MHQVRVALRRLRSDLRTLGDAVEPEWRQRIETQLRAIGGALGDSRDLDVMTDRLKRDADDMAAVLAPLFEHLAQRQAAARLALRETLEGAEYAALLDELAAAINVPPTGRAPEQAAQDRRSPGPARCIAGRRCRPGCDPRHPGRPCP